MMRSPVDLPRSLFTAQPLENNVDPSNSTDHTNYLFIQQSYFMIKIVKNIY